MKFIIGIRPQVLTVKGTLKNTRSHIQGIPTGSNQFGFGYVHYSRGLGGDPLYVYGYNMEVFKRGKHRKNKHVVIYKYTFPYEIFKLLNIKIKQGTRTFKIVPNNR